MIPQQTNPDQFNKMHEKNKRFGIEPVKICWLFIDDGQWISRALFSFKRINRTIWCFQDKMYFTCLNTYFVSILYVVACADSDLYNVDDCEINKHRITYKVNSSFYPSRNKRFSFTFKLFGAGIVFDGVFLYYLAVLTVNRWRLALLPFFFTLFVFASKWNLKHGLIQSTNLSTTRTTPLHSNRFYDRWINL